MPAPPCQALPPVQPFPSSQGVVSATVMPVHTPLWQVSPVVQALPSSHGVLSGSGVPAQTPPWQVSLLVQELWSSHAAPSSSAALPTQVPFWQVSAAVQKLPSSHFVPVNGVTVQLEVPLQMRVLHWSEVQVIAVPTQWSLPSQVSLKVQASPSSHGVLAGWRASDGQYTVVPVQVSAASHASVAARQTAPALGTGWMQRRLVSHG